MSLTYTDMFCGAGGSSLGLTAAGFELKLAANHSARAVETHAANFTTAEHVVADVSNYDMRKLPRTDVLWASPECTWHSPAGGRKRMRAQLDLLEDYVPDAVGQRSRATMFDVIRAAEAHRYTAVVVENVLEAADWLMFDWWLDGMVKLGYHPQIVSVSSAHIGGAGNPPAPQWRDRLYIVLTREGVTPPDVRPRPPAWCATCEADVAAVQWWKRPGRRRIGKYGAQYVYVCPTPRCHQVLVPYVAPAAAAIDWTNTGGRIGDRQRPLSPNTIARIQAGLDMFTRPAGGIGDGLVVPSGGTWNDTATPLQHPIRTRTTRETDGVCIPPYVVELRNHCTASSIEAPLSTITARGRHHWLVSPNVTKNYAGDPLAPSTTRDQHALVIPYRRSSRPRTAGEPLHTLHTKDSAAVVAPAADVEDCHFRMLQPREHLAAQRFPGDYIVTGNRAEQTAQAGNAVSANVAQWLGQKLGEVLT